MPIIWYNHFFVDKVIFFLGQCILYGHKNTNEQAENVSDLEGIKIREKKDGFSVLQENSCSDSVLLVFIPI